MADEGTRSGLWLNVILGLGAIAIVLFSESDSGQLALTLLFGAALVALAGYVSAAWERLPAGRRRMLAALSALVGLLLAGLWALQDAPVSTRDMEVAAGVLAALVGAYAWWPVGKEAQGSGGP